MTAQAIAISIELLIIVAMIYALIRQQETINAITTWAQSVDEHLGSEIADDTIDDDRDEFRND